MSDLVVTHYEHDGTVLNAFSPENLNFTLRKGEDGPHDITYEISRAIAVEDMVGAYRTDFRLQDAASTSPVTIMAGLHTSAPQMTSDEERVQIAGKDWLHYLEKRYWPYDDSDPNTYRKGIPITTYAEPFEPPAGFAYYIDPSNQPTGRDSMKIITDIFDMVLSLPNSLDINYLLADMGNAIQNFSIDIIDTENVLSKIQALSNEDPGEFDFWIDPDTKEFLYAAPYKYDIDVVTDSSLAAHIFNANLPASGVFAINYENVGPQATRMIGQGANQSSTLVSVNEYGPGSDQFRLLEDHVSFPNIITRERVQRLTRKALLFGLNPIHNVSIAVVPESVSNFWTTFYPGSAIWVTSDLEAHIIDAAFEIVSMDGTADLDGNMVVTMNLNQIYTPATL